MLVRKYRARNLQEALGQVKADLGDSATILSTRAVRAGFLRTQLEVTAALAPLDAPASRPAPAAPARPTAPTPSLEIGQVARFLAPLRQEIRALQTEMRCLAGTGEQGHRVESAIGELRELLVALQAAGANPGPAAERGLLQSLRDRLLHAGMRESLATAIVERVEQRLPADRLEASACLEGIAAGALAEELSCVEPLEHAPGRRVVALVGPAGVGKTTTLAKIAARAVLMHERRVALVGCDTDRIGARRALNDIAGLIGVEHRTAPDAEALQGAIDELAGAELILVDTSGYSARDRESLAALQAMLAAAAVEPCLVLNADMRTLELDSNLRGFALLEPRCLIITKVDQALGLAGVYDAARSSELPLMYLTNGRNIPDDIEAATPERIASLIMGFQYN